MVLLFPPTEKPSYAGHAVCECRGACLSSIQGIAEGEERSCCCLRAAAAWCCAAGRAVDRCGAGWKEGLTARSREPQALVSGQRCPRQGRTRISGTNVVNAGDQATSIMPAHLRRVAGGSSTSPSIALACGQLRFVGGQSCAAGFDQSKPRVSGLALGASETQ